MISSCVLPTNVKMDWQRNRRMDKALYRNVSKSWKGNYREGSRRECLCRGFYDGRDAKFRKRGRHQRDSGRGRNGGWIRRDPAKRRKMLNKEEKTETTVSRAGDRRSGAPQQLFAGAPWLALVQGPFNNSWGLLRVSLTMAKKKWNYLSLYFPALFLYIESRSIHILLQVKIIYNLSGERAL